MRGLRGEPRAQSGLLPALRPAARGSGSGLRRMPSPAAAMLVRVCPVPVRPSARPADDAPEIRPQPCRGPGIVRAVERSDHANGAGIADIVRAGPAARVAFARAWLQPGLRVAPSARSLAENTVGRIAAAAHARDARAGQPRRKRAPAESAR